MKTRWLRCRTRLDKNIFKIIFRMSSMLFKMEVMWKDILFGRFSTTLNVKFIEISLIFRGRWIYEEIWNALCRLQYTKLEKNSEKFLQMVQPVHQKPSFSKVNRTCCIYRIKLRLQIRIIHLHFQCWFIAIKQVTFELDNFQMCILVEHHLQYTWEWEEFLLSQSPLPEL